MNTQNKEYEIRMFDQIATRGGWHADFELYSFIKTCLYDRRIIVSGSILDVGCGTACYVHQAFHNSKVIGIDISQKSVDFANRKGCFALCYDADDIKCFPPATFDFIFCIAFLHHFKDIKNVLHNLDAWLKPGGNLIIYEPDSHNILFQISNYVRRVLERVGCIEWLLKHELATPNETLHNPTDYIPSGYKVILCKYFKSTRRDKVNIFGLARRVFFMFARKSYECVFMVLRKGEK